MKSSGTSQSRSTLPFKVLSVHFVYFVLGILLLASCKSNNEPAPNNTPNPADEFSYEIASKWADLQLILTQKTSGYTPPVASRAYGLGGLTMYESIVHGMLDHQSLAGQLSGLSKLPQPEAGKAYHWAISLNAGQATILRALYAEASLPQATNNLKVIDSLETALLETFSKQTNTDTQTRSIQLGKAIANAIFEWSKTDGGHEGYKRNFPVTYKTPVFPGAWQATENGQKIPMQPTWGNNRTFVPSNTTLVMPAPIPFSSSITSQYFAQYLEVYTKNKTLSTEEKEIAVWWADNPSETFTPPGHSYNIANIAAKSSKTTLGKAVEGFARTGIAVADAFIGCWKGKFTYMNERPYTMVRRSIDPDWKPFWPAPPFPGYSSGHATQSGAAAEVLTFVYGNNFKFIDNSHNGRANDPATNTPFKQRSFNNFYEFADESAMSRFLGGIHTRQDNEVGLREGKKIGRNVNNLIFSL